MGRVSPLDALAPDQRAVVELILGSRRSYAQIAELLGLPLDAVRARARAGLAALAPQNGLPPEVTGPLADYLLGQQSEPDARATYGLLDESAPARAWAGGVAARLADAAPGGLPQVPGEAGGPAAAGKAATVDTAAAVAAETSAATGDTAAPVTADTAADTAPPATNDASPMGAVAAAEDTTGDAGAPIAPPPASRLGGALLLAVGAVVVGLLLFLVLRDPGDEPSAAAPATVTATATPAPTAAPAQVADRIRLASPTGGRAKGTMLVVLREGRLGFELRATGVPPSPAGTAYAVWFTRRGRPARRLGFTGPVGAGGSLGIQGPSPGGETAFPELYASYDRVVVSQERSQTTREPSAKVVITGRLPRGR